MTSKVLVDIFIPTQTNLYTHACACALSGGPGGHPFPLDGLQRLWGAICFMLSPGVCFHGCSPATGHSVVRGTVDRFVVVPTCFMLSPGVCFHGCSPATGHFVVWGTVDRFVVVGAACSFLAMVL